MTFDESVIHYPDNLSPQLISKSILMNTWSQQLDPEIQINSVNVISADIFPNNRIGFYEAEINYTSNSVNDKERIIMSGGSSSIVVLIRCLETNEIYTVLVKQPRIGSGKLQYEYPAGLTDDSTDFRLTAVRELEEECNIKANKEEIININKLLYENDVKFFTNAHLFYEATSVYLYVKSMTRAEINALEGSYGGVDEDEQITLHICKFDDVFLISQDPTTISITFLLKTLIKKRKIVI